MEVQEKKTEVLGVDTLNENEPIKGCKKNGQAWEVIVFNYDIVLDEEMCSKGP